MNSDRYEIHNIKWKRTGPRSGWLRRRRWRMRVWKVATAADLTVAAQLLANAPLSWDEAVYLYDNEHVLQGKRIGARYGQDWKP